MHKLRMGHRLRLQCARLTGLAWVSSGHDLPGGLSCRGRYEGGARGARLRRAPASACLRCEGYPDALP